MKVSSPDNIVSPSRQRLLASSGRRYSSIYGSKKSLNLDSNLPINPGTKQHKASSTIYSNNSSSLSPHPTETQYVSESCRQIDDSESTASTTPHSTVWDELEDLKSRIQRLEIGGKIPSNHAGTEITRFSNERPRTATTTLTSVSTSPHCEVVEIKSPVEATSPAAIQDTHHLLKSALIKSKQFVDMEIYKALEATTTDALSISSMMGSSGQPGPISKSQANTSFGYTLPVSDRQVRRKAESMCRSLTELCLALSEKKPNQDRQHLPPNGHDENQNQLSKLNKPAPIIPIPRGLSQLEARRSNLLAPSVSRSLKVMPKPETSKNKALAGRNSIFHRGSRTILNESDEDDEQNFRAPSRVFSEIHSFRNASRETRVGPLLGH